jgi:lysozyme
LAKRRKSAGSRKKASRKQKKNLKWAIWLLFALGIAAFFYFREITDTLVESPHHFRKTVPPGYAAIGIDVSHHQGKIDWEELLEKKGFDTIIDFVYCKVTEGDDHLDTQYERNRTELNDRGVLNGAYHYFSTKRPPRPQAAHFLAHWKKRDIDLPPVLDVEDEGLSDNDLIAKMKIWLEEVEKGSGLRPVIYTSLSFYETKFRNKLPGYKFWLAAYSRQPLYMPDPAVIHWQYSETGRLPGIKNEVDLNVSKLNMNEVP